jgi:hypothetical protein
MLPKVAATRPAVTATLTMTLLISDLPKGYNPAHFRRVASTLPNAKDSGNVRNSKMKG